MDYEFIRTVCPYCAVGCNLLLEVMDGEIINTHPVKRAFDGKASLCIKGWSVHELIQHPDRLRRPLIRSNGAAHEADWDEALGYAAKELGRLREAYGPESIAFVGSARCTNEEAYLFQKFARSFSGHNHVDHCARL
jgi:predicted molibdopterin-dependent oxidoreductase YjgC